MAQLILAAAAKAAEWVSMQFFQAAVGAGLSVQTAATVANVAYFATQGLVYAGAFATVAALAPGVPNAEQGKVPVNQTTPLRRMGTGRARLSGPRACWEGIAGWNIEIIYLHEGPIDGFEQWWLHDDPVSIDEEGRVTGLSDKRYGDPKGDVKILFRHGRHDDAPLTEIIDLFDDAGVSELWSEAHEGRGIAKVALLCRAVKDTVSFERYPNGPPALSVTTRLSRVYDWRDPTQALMDPTTWKWSQNAVVNHMHWEWCLRHLPCEGPTGEGWIQGELYPEGHPQEGQPVPPPTICLEAWHADLAPRLETITVWADQADEPVSLKAGGTEPRWRQGGWWFVGTEPAEIRKRFLDCYDGWMSEGSDGALVLHGGGYVAPTYVVTDRNLIEAGWNRWAEDRSTVNILTATFTSPDHGFSPQEAQAWRDDVSIARIGDKPQAVNLEWVQSHAQARRLLKALAARVFAERHGDLVMDLEGLNALERRYLQLTRKRGPTSMRSVPLEVMGAQIDLTQGRVPLGVVRADPNKYVWNAATEEGDGPSTVERAPVVAPPLPEILGTTVEGDANGVRVRIRFDDPGRPGLTFATRWRVTGAPSWIEESPRAPDPEDGDLSVATGFVMPAVLDVAIQAWSAAAASDWTAPEAVDATLEPEAPVATRPTGLTVEQDGADVVVSFGLLDDHGRVFRGGASAEFEDAIDVSGELAASPGVAVIWRDEAVAPGSYRYWAVSELADDSPSGPAGPAPIVVV